MVGLIDEPAIRATLVDLEPPAEHRPLPAARAAAAKAVQERLFDVGFGHWIEQRLGGRSDSGCQVAMLSGCRLPVTGCRVAGCQVAVASPPATDNGQPHQAQQVLDKSATEVPH